MTGTPQHVAGGRVATRFPPRAAGRTTGLLGSFDWDLALLQEVTAPTFTRLLELLAGEGVNGASALDLCEVPDHRRPLGCAVLIRRPLTITAIGLIPGQPRPERGLYVAIDGQQVPLTACS